MSRKSYLLLSLSAVILGLAGIVVVWQLIQFHGRAFQSSPRLVVGTILGDARQISSDVLSGRETDLAALSGVSNRLDQVFFRSLSRPIKDVYYKVFFENGVKEMVIVDERVSGKDAVVRVRFTPLLPLNAKEEEIDFKMKKRGFYWYIIGIDPVKDSSKPR